METDGFQGHQGVPTNHHATVAQFLHERVDHQLQELVKCLACHLCAHCHSPQQKRGEEGSIVGRGGWGGE